MLIVIRCGHMVDISTMIIRVITKKRYVGKFDDRGPECTSVKSAISDNRNFWSVVRVVASFDKIQGA